MFFFSILYSNVAEFRFYNNYIIVLSRDKRAFMFGLPIHFMIYVSKMFIILFTFVIYFNFFTSHCHRYKVFYMRKCFVNFPRSF